MPRFRIALALAAVLASLALTACGMQAATPPGAAPAVQCSRD